MSDSIPVTISPYGRGAGSTRVRIHDWFTHLGLDQENHSYLGASSNPARSMARDPFRVGRAELDLRILSRSVSNRIVLMSREASPLSNGRIEASLLSKAGHGVYDFDDALFHSTGGLVRKVWSKEKVWRAAVSASDIVIAGSEILADAACKLNDNVLMVPSCVEPSAYVVKSDYELSSPPRCVWIGSPATEPLLASITEPLLNLNRKYGLRLTVISRGQRPLGDLDEIVDRVEWREQNYIWQLAEADFGIMPLPDTPFTRGKCAYKLLQYGAVGLPSIASPVGANMQAIRRMQSFAATSKDEWYSAGSTLIEQSHSARNAMGTAARSAVKSNYSFEAWEEPWRAALSLKKPQGSK